MDMSVLQMDHQLHDTLGFIHPHLDLHHRLHPDLDPLPLKIITQPILQTIEKRITPLFNFPVILSSTQQY